jgi:hypothetical protein
MILWRFIFSLCYYVLFFFTMPKPALPLKWIKEIEEVNEDAFDAPLA